MRRQEIKVTKPKENQGEMCGVSKECKGTEINQEMQLKINMI